MKNKVKKIQFDEESGDLYILYFPTDTVTTREIELATKELNRQNGFVPDMIVIDYLECLLSKNPHRNKNEYERQKSVSNEVRALGAVTNTHIASASQTNRGGSSAAEDGKDINLDKLAESYGKAMPTDYILSINQTKKDYEGNDSNSHIGHFRFFFAKNRNGPKNVVVQGEVNYATMKVKQEEV